MIKINSIDELRSAKARLYFRKEELEEEMKNNFKSLKHSVTPSGIVENMRSSKKSTTTSNHAPPGILSNVASTAMDFMINDMFFRRTSYFKRIIISYLIRMFGPTVLNNAGPAVTRLVKKMNLFNHNPSKNGKRIMEGPVYTHGV